MPTSSIDSRVACVSITVTIAQNGSSTFRAAIQVTVETVPSPLAARDIQIASSMATSRSKEEPNDSGLSARARKRTSFSKRHSSQLTRRTNNVSLIPHSISTPHDHRTEFRHTPSTYSDPCSSPNLEPRNRIHQTFTVGRTFRHCSVLKQTAKQPARGGRGRLSRG